MVVSIRRKALSPYTFSNGGPHVPAGEIACVPAWEIMHNELRYPNAKAFDGLRFVQNVHTKASALPNDAMRGTTFTDASQDFPIWGLGSKVWYASRNQSQRLPLIVLSPGRWHSSFVIKMALVYLIVHYDFQLEAKPESYRWFWDTFQMPYESSKVLIRKRQQYKKEQN